MRTFIRQVMGAVAELDCSILVARMKAGREKKRERGEKGSGRYPFGWSKEGPVVREQAVLTAVRALRDDGLSFATIAVRLNNRGAEWYARMGRPWTRQHLAVATATR